MTFLLYLLIVLVTFLDTSLQQQQYQQTQPQTQQVVQQPQQQNAVNWFENLPAVAMDYKVHIDPGKEDCYFQYVNPGATFYVSFQVRFT